MVLSFTNNSSMPDCNCNRYSASVIAAIMITTMDNAEATHCIRVFSGKKYFKIKTRETKATEKARLNSAGTNPGINAFSISMFVIQPSITVILITKQAIELSITNMGSLTLNIKNSS